MFGYFTISLLSTNQVPIMMKIASAVIADLLRHATDEAPIEARGYLAAREDAEEIEIVD